MEKKVLIGETAAMLGVSIQTLRRWDDDGFFNSARYQHGKLSRRYYTESKVNNFLENNYKYLANICYRWAFNKGAGWIPSELYCPDRSIFKGRLSKLEMLLSKDRSIGDRFSIITSIVGEIGNNSFDHNLGSWTDVRGIIFSYNLAKREIILADRGQGILTTLKRVKKELSDHESAIKVAFTEFISGRAPENRGNGLKYVRSEVKAYPNISMYFQSGDAFVEISDNDDLKIKKTSKPNMGCFVKINY